MAMVVMTIIFFLSSFAVSILALCSEGRDERFEDGREGYRS
jgi:hypothetical protein